MVNYCCVQGCGRNSRVNKYLNYYSLPKKKARQKLWLNAAGKDHLLTEDLKKRRTLRFCSRHFAPNNIKNRHLTEDAVPSKCLPGSLSEDDEDKEPAIHEGIICDNCSEKIIGFRYKCVTCDNYDLCQKCEMLESHSDHYMLRIPRPLKFKIADNLINKWREFFKSEHIVPKSDDLTKKTYETDVSSDDEPVKKYVKNNNIGIDLAEDVKQIIQMEVKKAIELAQKQEKSRGNLKRTAIENDDNLPSKKQRSNEESLLIVQVDGIEDVKNIKDEIAIEEHTPELVFADVNEAETNQNLVKSDICSTGPHPEEQDNLRAFYLKMGIDLSQLMIQVVPGSEEPS